MKLQTQWIYHRYFSSVEKIVLSSIQVFITVVEIIDCLQIIFDRLTQPKLRHFPLLQPKLQHGQQKFTAILHASKKSNNRATKIIDMLAEFGEIENVSIDN